MRKVRRKERRKDSRKGREKGRKKGKGGREVRNFNPEKNLKS